MKINIYYGGRGVLDDPTLYVVNKMQAVFEELNVQVERYNLYEQKNVIITLPQTLKEADGVVLATTIEWIGIGGYMQQFLDACWLYGDKEKIAQIYMQPVVMSTTYGEREGAMTLTNSWEMLGGLLCNGICGYVEDLVTFELNQEYTSIIEKKAEDLYRTIFQQIKSLPTSNQTVKQTAMRSKQLELTPQESEQLSRYVADDGYVQKQREDIAELTDMFKNLLGESKGDDDSEYVKAFKDHFVGMDLVKATYLFIVEDKNTSLVVEIENKTLQCYYGNPENIDVAVKITSEVLDSIVSGRMTFQRAFMAGAMSAKGNFKTLRTLDELFQFAS